MRRIPYVASLLLALSSCATQTSLPPAPPRVIEVPVAKLAPVPAWIMEPRKPDFLERLLSFYGVLLPKQIPPSSP